MTGIVQTLIGGFGAVAAAVTDAYFNLVTLLLPGNGTNGAQNNTFIDSSTNNFTITRNGNTTQGTFSPFSQTGWSISVTSNTGPSALSYGNSTNLALGSGDFCAEAFIYMTSAASGAILDWRTNGGTTANIPVLYVNSSGVPIFEGTGGSVLITGSSSVSLNSWTHIALVRSGTTITIYLNGVSVGTATSNTTNFGIGTFNVNNPQSTAFSFVGYISNVRIVKGSPVYTGAFTPPTSPLTAITNTQLLTCQSNRFVDNSTNAFAITVGGTPSVQAFSPFAPTAAYSAATNGGSGYFDGSGDYLSIANNTALQMGTGDFQVEAWVYVTNSSAFQAIICIGVSTGVSTAGTFTLRVQSDLKVRWCINDNSTGVTSTNAITANAWVHVCASRVSGTTRIFINGVDNGSLADSNNYNNTSGTMIGAENQGGATNNFYGYISGLRVVKGSGVTSVTVPTSPPTAITNTQLLANYTNAGITDATAKNDLETVGNAQVSTTQSKWGGSSMYFDGTGDWLTLPASQSLVLGTADFTLEAWIYTTSSATQRIFSFGTGNNCETLLVNTGSNVYLNFYNGTTDYGSTSYVVSQNQWVHIAVTRSSNNLRLFINGTLQNTPTSITNNYTANTLIIGKYGAGTPDAAFVGYMDDVRITRGYARYTANFSVPTSAFPVQ